MRYYPHCSALSADVVTACSNGAQSTVILAECYFDGDDSFYLLSTCATLLAKSST